MEYSEEQIKIHSRITENIERKKRNWIFTGNVFLSMYYLRMADVHIISVYIRQGMFHRRIASLKTSAAEA